MKHPIFVQKTMGGNAAHPPVDLATALTKEWSFDAHTVQYEGDVRLNKGEGELRIVVELYDFDNKALPDAAREVWAKACLAKLPEGFCGYRTAGGFRALTLRETPFIVNDAEQWEEWRQYHGGRAEALGAIIGAAPDHATDEPNRLFRLPMALREDGKPRYPELYGEIGYATLAPAPYVRRAASEIYVDGDASHSMVGAAFTAGGLVTGRSGQKLNVTCPWQHTHSGGKGGGTFVDDTEDHMGHFVCAHSHCQGHTSWDALDALRALPGVAAELAHWPEPTNVLTPYARVEEIAAVPAEPAPTSPWLSWGEIMAPLPPLDWLCKDLQLCPGRPAAFVAEPNAGKTWALQSLALSVASGLPVFGRFPAKQGPVLHVSTDAGEYATRWRYQMLAQGMGIKEALPVRVWPGRLKCVDNYGRFEPKGLAPILGEAARGNYALVILDSLFAIAAGLDMMAPEAAEPLWHSKNHPGVWLWAMHSPKGKPGFFGSQAIAAACGAMWNLSLDDGDKNKPRLWEIGRRVEEYQGDVLETFHTTWDRDLDAVGQLTGARILCVEAEPKADVVSATQQMQYDMLTYIHRHGSATYTDLCTAAAVPPGTTGRPKRRASAVIGALAQAGLIVSPLGTTYIPGPGTLPPKAAHQVQELVRIGNE